MKLNEIFLKSKKISHKIKNNKSNMKKSDKRSKKIVYFIGLLKIKIDNFFLKFERKKLKENN
jgi:hypothetical protein